MHRSDTRKGQRETSAEAPTPDRSYLCGRNEWPTAEVCVAASIYPADRLHLTEAVTLVEQAGCDAIHVDIMDGDFAPPIAVGLAVVESVRAITNLPLDIHLQVAHPELMIDAILEAGCETLTLHVETTHHLHRLGEKVRAAGAKFGIGLNLATPLCYVEELLGIVDLIILMATDPGVSGYSPKVVNRIHHVHRLLDAAGRTNVRVGVDGGVSPHTAKALYDVGATWLIAGSSLWREDPVVAVTSIRAAAIGGGNPIPPYGHSAGTV